MSLVFRPARADEIQRAQELVVRSINDLTERHGFGPMATLRPAPDFQLFSLKDDPDGLWVAESDGEIVGFALSWVCGKLWFLAELFVAPSHQGRRVGNELLARTFEHARKAGATNKSNALELLVAFLQAYVFAILTCIYLNDATVDGEQIWLALHLFYELPNDRAELSRLFKDPQMEAKGRLDR